MRNELLHKFKKLTQLLIVSGSLNILMLALLFYWYFKEQPPTPLCERKPTSYDSQIGYGTIEYGNEEVLRQFEKMSMSQLMEKLKDARLVESGFAIRDLALGSLLTYHHFDLQRALAGARMPIQKRYIIFKDIQGQKKELITYSDINPDQYEKILAFINTEKWPYTTQGLFILLKEKRPEKDKSLEYAFLITPEFQAVDLLFKRSNVDIPRGEILDFLLEGSWKMLSNFAEKQRLQQDLSPEKRRELLFSYIENESAAAAALLLKTDSNTVAKKFDDTQVATILKYSTKRTPHTARFALAMLASPRNDKVWKEAAYRLYEFAGEAIPTEFNRNSVLARFLPLAIKKTTSSETSKRKNVETIVAEKLEQKKPANPRPVQDQDVEQDTAKHKNKWKRAYISQEKDSLWKISKMFNVDIEELKQQNNLTNDSLKPGTMIIVP